jgi:hypothetical protein
MTPAEQEHDGEYDAEEAERRRTSALVIFRQSFPVGTTVAGSTMSTTVRPTACGRCTMPRGIVTP